MGHHVVAEDFSALHYTLEFNSPWRPFLQNGRFVDGAAEPSLRRRGNVGREGQGPGGRDLTAVAAARECVVVTVMTSLTYVVARLIDPNEQALRAADAGWETARWTFWLVVATFLLVAGAAAAAVYAKRTWETTKGQLRAAEKERDNSNEQLELAKRMDLEREAVHVTVWLQHEMGDLNAFVHNGNPGPVYDVVVSPLIKADATGELEAKTDEWSTVVLPPSSSMIANYPTIVLEANECIRGRTGRPDRPADPIFNSFEDFRIWDGQPGTTGVALEITFRDSAGVSWHRAWNGKLTRQDI